MNFLIQVAGTSLKGGISAYLAVIMAASPVQTAQMQNVADLAFKADNSTLPLDLSSVRPTIQT